MESKSPLFAHVLLFACPGCNRPLAAACTSPKRNLETADAHLFTPHCHCGWSGPLLGLTAAKHWIQPWPEVEIGPGEDGSCDRGTSYTLPAKTAN